jgi:hypothetical protein
MSRHFFSAIAPYSHGELETADLFYSSEAALADPSLSLASKIGKM